MAMMKALVLMSTVRNQCFAFFHNHYLFSVLDHTTSLYSSISLISPARYAAQQRKHTYIVSMASSDDKRKITNMKRNMEIPLDRYESN